MNVRTDSETIKYFLRKDHPLLCYIDDQCESIPSRGRFTSYESHDRQNSIVDSSWKSVNYSRLVLRTNVEDARQQVSNCALCSNVFTLAIVPRYFFHLSHYIFRSFFRFRCVPCFMFRQRIKLKRDVRDVRWEVIWLAACQRVNQSAHDTSKESIIRFFVSPKKFPILFSLRFAILYES